MNADESDGVQRVLRNDSDWREIATARTLRPFSEVVLNFCDEISRTIFSDNAAKSFPELVALAFWLRPSNTKTLSQGYRQRSTTYVLVPRGTVFHIAPSNVDTLFFYSWVLSLLCGNRNIIRLSSKTSPQLETLLRILDGCLENPDLASVARRLSIVQYEHSFATTSAISAVADTRVIWGGDATIDAIRQCQISASTNELTFADKLSIALVDGEYWTNANTEDRAGLARRFAIDAYQFGQAACSSPRALIWLGQTPTDRLRDEFWDLVEGAIPESMGHFQDIDYIEKLVSSHLIAIKTEAKIQSRKDNRVTRVSVQSGDLSTILESEVHCGAGLFFESSIDSLEILLPILTRRVQTLAYAGLSPATLLKLFESHRCDGVDRVVPIGKSLDFHHIWDGYDLIESFLRRITIA